MAFCTKCGYQLREGALFCTECGAPVKQASAGFCTKCGNQLRDDLAFCTKCGAPVKKPGLRSASCETGPSAMRPHEKGRSHKPASEPEQDSASSKRPKSRVASNGAILQDGSAANGEFLAEKVSEFSKAIEAGATWAGERLKTSVEGAVNGYKAAKSGVSEEADDKLAGALTSLVLPVFKWEKRQKGKLASGDAGRQVENRQVEQRKLAFLIVGLLLVITFAWGTVGLIASRGDTANAASSGDASSAKAAVETKGTSKKMQAKKANKAKARAKKKEQAKARTEAEKKEQEEAQQGSAESETNSDTSATEVLTVENCADLANTLSSSSSDASAFAVAYKGRTIEFDGNIAYMGSHEGAKTRFDVLIYAGDYSETSCKGPNMQYRDVNYYNMGPDSSIDSIQMGLNVRIRAVVEEYDASADILRLKPVSMTAR